MAVDSETLFAREAALREAAINYRDWAVNADANKSANRDQINASRKRLRAAAVAYADAAREVDA